MTKFFAIPIFLCILAILTWLSKPLYQNVIEKDLLEKVTKVTKRHVSNSHQNEQLNLQLNGNSLQIDLKHLPQDISLKVKEELQQIVGLNAVHLKAIDDPEPKVPNAIEQAETKPIQIIADNEVSATTSPPFFVITRSSLKNSIFIKGELSSINEKEQLINALTTEFNLPESEKIITHDLIVSNKVTTIRNSQTVFTASAKFICETKASNIDWTSQQITLTGEAKDDEAIDSVIQLFTKLSDPETKILSQNLNKIKPPSLHFTLERLSNNTIILKGTLPNEEMGQSLYELVVQAHTATMEANKKSHVSNNFRYTDLEIKAWWLGKPESFISDFLKQTEGIAKIDYSDEGLYIEGIYKELENYNKARSSFSSIPESIEIYDDFLRVK